MPSEVPDAGVPAQLTVAHVLVCNRALVGVIEDADYADAFRCTVLHSRRGARRTIVMSRYTLRQSSGAATV